MAQTTRHHVIRALVVVAALLATTGLIYGGISLLGTTRRTVSEPLGLGQPRVPVSTPRATGYSLLVLQRFRLDAIDLDTGHQWTVAVIEGGIQVLPGDGTHLLPFDRGALVATGSRVLGVNLREGTLEGSRPGVRLALSTNPGRVWVLEPPTISADVWTELDALGTAVRTTTLMPEARMLDPVSGTPEILWRPGDGIYRLGPADQQPDAAQWSRITTAAPVAASATQGIVRQCRDECAYTWIDLLTGQTLPGTNPPTFEFPGPRLRRLSPSGRHVLEVRRASLPVAAFRRDGVARLTGCDQGWSRAVWSPDESLLACPLDDRIVITDLDTGHVVPIEGFRPIDLAIVESTAFDG